MKEIGSKGVFRTVASVLYGTRYSHDPLNPYQSCRANFFYEHASEHINAFIYTIQIRQTLQGAR